MTFGSLFAGIGGFDLGFERARLKCSWQVEIDEYCRRVLERHWPNVRRWDDVRTFPPLPLRDWRVDVLCGGFPCQDISEAGKGAGIDGERSGLWRDYARIIRICRTCGKDWIVGDCIPDECTECQCKRLGHLPVGSICGRCGHRFTLTDAIEKARGGPAPTPRQGFA